MRAAGSSGRAAGRAAECPWLAAAGPCAVRAVQPIRRAQAVVDPASIRPRAGSGARRGRR